ncbi:MULTISPECIES: DUF6894 family protein [Methylobacterium]|uniref:DUF6894 family protein n=1 Tax=Methylobacterium TaxID=407 RepID=UPI000B0322A0|nr:MULTISPECIES: hypothetical protein [Methylobacterium]MCI9880962.1 hypothetical protein [Methylobacterium goesingense]
MPQYFLNIRDRGTLILDPEGDVLPGLREARDLVERTVRDIRRRPETYGCPDLWNSRSFEVTDQSGEILLEIAFSSVR